MYSGKPKKSDPLLVQLFLNTDLSFTNETSRFSLNVTFK
jgi:hypothetical protein